MTYLKQFIFSMIAYDHLEKSDKYCVCKRVVALQFKIAFIPSTCAKDLAFNLLIYILIYIYIYIYIYTYKWS